MNDESQLDPETHDAEAADSARAHAADRPPTADEEQAADRGAADVDEKAVAAHEEEMNEIGADVKGEGEIS